MFQEPCFNLIVALEYTGRSHYIQFPFA